MIRGLMNGCVLQRGSDNRSDFLLQTDEPIGSVLYHPLAPQGEAARSSEEEGQAGIEPYADSLVRITGIPAGGPYRVVINRRYAFEPVYVGDLWVLAGQSNMQGVGWYREGDRQPPDDEVRALYMENIWRAAAHPLHSEWKAFDPVHTKVLHAVPPDTDYNGVGPGVSFGLRMKELTGVPQGLICCAHGGTSMAQWSPALRGLGPGGSLYAAMLRRFLDCGSHIRGIFWYQGCADAFEHTDDVFEEALTALISACRRDLSYGDEALPILQVQIGRVVHRPLPGLTESWSSIREIQRRLSDVLPDLLTLSSVTLTLDDLIHLDGVSQDRLGRQAAEAIHEYLRSGKRPPRLASCRLYSHPVSGRAAIDLRFDGLCGGLCAGGRVGGFTIAPQGKPPAEDTVYAVSLSGDTATLRLHRPTEEALGCDLYYGYGLDPYANLTDGRKRAIPCFGPIRLPSSPNEKELLL